MFRKIISVYYIYYAKTPFEDAYSASIFLACATQQLWLYILLEFLNRTFGMPLLVPTGNIYLVIPVSIFWAWAFFKICPKNKVLKFVDEFKLESKARKWMWKIFSFCLFIIPFLIIFFYF